MAITGRCERVLDMRIALSFLLVILFCGISSADEVYIQLRFDIVTEYGKFSDALFYTETEYANITQDRIDADKKERISVFIDQIKNPRLEVPLKESDLISLKSEYIDLVAQKQQEIILLDTAIIEAKNTAKDKDAPSVPANLRILKFSEDTLVLGWDSSADAKTSVIGYTVYKNGVKYSSISETIFYDTKFISKESYTYNVSAIDKAGNESALSAQVLYPEKKIK